MQGCLRVLARRLTVPRFPRVQTRPMRREPGAREKILLEEDPALKKFRYYKDTVRRIQRFGDVLVLAVVAGSVYEISGVLKPGELHKYKSPSSEPDDH